MNAASMMRRLRLFGRYARAGVRRRRHVVALLIGLGGYGSMAVDAVAANWQLAFDPQSNRSLAEGVLFLLDKRAAGPELQRGDIVAFRPPAHAAALFPEPERLKFIKRAAGLPGDRVEVTVRDTRVNGVVVGEGLALAAFLQADVGFFVRSFTVPEGFLFPMGETEDSYDGRYYGLTPFASILGRARRLL
ncbi:signal peptidase I [Rubrimonas cliftonensis]|uniref:Signal peptidase I n=1 Tax=Rubrimonas cliftonensis TaxID=89524 RepID=A0A1H4EP94_9RHOB|nr:signal peptidase I [Rubrimonas cliftonensis]SEA86903.1 conjugal transfer pilin signal peptidase TrbI [Rubrimonas cliftonensis]